VNRERSSHALRPARLILLSCWMTFGTALGQPTPAARTPAVLQRVGRSQLCVTNGAVTDARGGRLMVETPSSRAIVPGSAPGVAEIRFRYLGPSVGSKPLASGEMRRQIGLKLRAQDTCNLVYAMWHIEPDSRIAVSVKRNPGKHTHQQCGPRGYLNVKPRRTVPVAKVLEGETHRLRATLRGGDLRVEADGRTVWEGQLETASLDFEGPSGFRTDNARFELELLVSPGGESLVDPGLNHCAPSAGD
jgi:hypothetical protein